jgi:hypothetical protein
MAHVLADYVLDNGLAAISTEAHTIVICSQDPTTFTEATSTYKVGHKTWAVGGAAGAPVARSPKGRKVMTTAIIDGTVDATATATAWAILDLANSRVHANGAVDASSPMQATGTDAFRNQHMAT